jgi:excisionase family DNA binding protein
MVRTKDQPVTFDLAQQAEPRPMFLTAAEVGQELGLKKSRVYELAAAGLLPVVRLGRRMLFPRRGLDELVDAAIEQARQTRSQFVLMDA